ncbi:ferredoxin--NADP reductase [Arthrobacter sp. zg-Y820]|uniref:ferredoxin--NADP reductase n=1 Tax=unclassified Arthrobacter TaxID=235627 RepID=UPI001E4D36C2|nr:MULTISPECIES: ferredoxin--NADP reductase [unclassified Arthrobacter]MCC9195440.1 ferredoxin--NADP reductase [Arthrobacter sp. zg-Y820]MDK1278299.1 ferredoxin--NADP reductase [Arthrobacter sp. zg.Y820]WIB10178.1 ferredoxin--NADP reductase [Arthrobacter sp. zg-Y820]
MTNEAMTSVKSAAVNTVTTEIATTETVTANAAPAATPLQVRVVEVIRETADAHTLVLEPAGGSGETISYKPGQFLTVRIPSERPSGAARCYSLCSSPLQDEKLKITVKRTREGYGSNWLCDNVVEGHMLDILRPAGTFTPHSLTTDFLLFAGGSGVTPVMSIIKSALAGGTGLITLIYANQDESSVIFREELIALTKAHPGRLNVIHWLGTVQGLPDTASIGALAAPYTDREVFICGPGPFMDCVALSLNTLGMPPERIHIERFTSLGTDPFAPVAVVVDDTTGENAVVEVQLDGQSSSVAWPGGNRLLDVLLNAGLDAPFSCREGACSACVCRVLEGEVRMEKNEVLDDTDLREGYTLACQAVPVSAKVRVTYDE